MTDIIIKISNSSQLYRKPHDKEIIDFDSGNWRYGGDGYRQGAVRQVVRESNTGRPEVYRLDGQQTSLNCAWQRLWRELNPKLSDKKWGTLLGDELAWCNSTGTSGRYNCILNTNIGMKFPAFSATIINGGAILKGIVKGDYITLESLDVASPTPPTEEVLNKPWLWFWGTNVTPSGKVGYITRQGIDGTMYPVRVPFITERPVQIPVNWLHKLPINSPIPDARWLAT